MGLLYYNGIPTNVKIGGHNYKIRYPYSFISNDDSYGEIRPKMNLILIRDIDQSGVTLPKSTIWVTFIHELLHAVDHVSGRVVFKDEHSVEACSEIMYQILVNNNWINIE